MNAETTQSQRSAGMAPCCERDHDGDGRCDRHRPGTATTGRRSTAAVGAEALRRVAHDLDAMSGEVDSGGIRTVTMKHGLRGVSGELKTYAQFLEDFDGLVAKDRDRILALERRERELIDATTSAQAEAARVRRELASVKGKLAAAVRGKATGNGQQASGKVAQKRAG